jgi:hypothetical protein
MPSLEDVDAAKQPAVTPFHRTDMDDDCFKFIVSARPLFRNLPQPGRTPIQSLSMDDLKSPSTYLQQVIDSATVEHQNRINCVTKPDKNAAKGLEFKHCRRFNHR